MVTLRKAIISDCTVSHAFASSAKMPGSVTKNEESQVPTSVETQPQRALAKASFCRLGSSARIDFSLLLLVVLRRVLLGIHNVHLLLQIGTGQLEGERIGRGTRLPTLLNI